jgi:hypothetical protein
MEKFIKIRDGVWINSLGWRVILKTEYNVSLRISAFILDNNEKFIDSCVACMENKENPHCSFWCIDKLAAEFNAAVDRNDLEEENRRIDESWRKKHKENLADSTVAGMNYTKEEFNAAVDRVATPRGISGLWKFFPEKNDVSETIEDCAPIADFEVRGKSLSERMPDYEKERGLLPVNSFGDIVGAIKVSLKTPRIYTDADADEAKHLIRKGVEIFHDGWHKAFLTDIKLWGKNRFEISISDDSQMYFAFIREIVE